MTNLIIAHHNIRSINAHIHDLKIYIQENKPDIITLNETIKIPNNLKILGYKFTTPDPNPGQGVAIIYKNTLNVTNLPIIETNNPTKNIQHSILITSNKTKIQISTIYCPLGKPNINLIENIIKRHTNTIITGDFNIKHVDLGHPTNTKAGNDL